MIVELREMGSEKISGAKTIFGSDNFNFFRCQQLPKKNDGAESQSDADDEFTLRQHRQCYRDMLERIRDSKRGRAGACSRFRG